MCIICLEFNKTKDLMDARRMIEAARREPGSIGPDHLTEVEKRVREAEEAGGLTP